MSGRRVTFLGGGLERFSCFCRAGLLGRVERVFQLVPSAAQAAESPQSRAELGSDDFLDHVMAAGGGGAQTLLCQEGDASLPCRVIGKDDAAVGCLICEGAGRLESAPRPVEPRRPVRLRALNPLDVPGG